MRTFSSMRWGMRRGQKNGAGTRPTPFVTSVAPRLLEEYFDAAVSAFLDAVDGFGRRLVFAKVLDIDV